MSDDILQKLDAAISGWQQPDAPDDIPQGDMPGDRVWIGPQAVKKAGTAFRAVLPLLRAAIAANPKRRAVISVSGGSGVGKTCVSALITYYLNQLGIGAYTLSGDNYPHRIPLQNDAERVRIFRASGVHGLLRAGEYSAERAQILRELQLSDRDSDPAACAEYPWLEAYQRAGREKLSEYLGSDAEQEFEQMQATLSGFRQGAETLWLKRLGAAPEDLWYEAKDFRAISVLVLEWTHANSPAITNVDVPVLLSSTPAETRAYRLARGRNANADTAFITMVIELEQAILESRAGSAKVIVSNACELITYDQYKAQMSAGR